MKRALIMIAVGAAALVLMLPSFIFVSIVWTHRPDLSVMDIALLAVREIKDTILKAGRWSGGKEKGEYENHHL